MPEYIGNIEVPVISPSGVLPLIVLYGLVKIIEPQIVTHTFGAANAKREQRFKLGPDLRRFIIDQEIWEDERETLVAFWEARTGAHQPFTFNVPLEGGGTEAVTVAFADAPLPPEFAGPQKWSIHLELLEVATGDGESYELTDAVTIPEIGEWKRSGRPTDDIAAFLSDALLEQAQVMIPLVRIQPRLAGYPEIFLSDRRVTIDGQLYQPRLQWSRCEGIGQIAVGLPGGDEAPDDVTLIFGDADRVLRLLAEDVRLDYAAVEFSGFHVGTGIRLDIWAGEVQPRGWDSQPPDFILKCSDPIASPNMQAPDREITRKCPWAFDDGFDCPFSDSDVGGELDLVNFPTADAGSCDHGYDTPNGCLAHGMERFYGGVTAVPQAVRVKDNSTGLWGLGRSWMTSVSLIGDSVYGLPLPEIYTDILMPVPAYLINGRDEGDFYQAIGIVGEGPLGRYGVGHKLDGQPNHGPGTLGLREVLGTHPAGPTDYLSLDQLGDQTNGDFRKVFDGFSTFLRNFSAGVAFVSIRRIDEKGRQLTRLEEHSMEVVVEWGLGGWTWTAPGTRVWQEHLTNPIWIQVNRHLRTTGLKNGTAEQQETAFDVRAAIYHAAICDLEVTRIVGEGTETQFKFIGRIATSRPHRSWLNDIGLNCLGYFTNSFGKLKLGVRVNSSTVSAFSSGNMLLNSLKLSAHGTEFNRLTCTFSDVLQDVNTGENQFVANTARAQDDDFAVELGGGTRAVYLDGQMNLAGTSNISQAQRIATTIMREEVGGVSAEERLKARWATWGTTIMALDTEAGDVDSVTDPEMPGGTGEFRIYRWRLKPDWSIELQGRTVTDSMYDLVMGPKPADVLADPVIPELFPDPLGQAWHPYHVRPVVDDPVYDENEYKFFLAAFNQTLGNGIVKPSLFISGGLPINTFLPNTQPPIIRALTASATGGVLPGGREFTVSACAWVRGLGYTPHSNFLKVITPEGTDTCSLNIGEVTWPAGDFSDGGYTLFAAMEEDRLICADDSAFVSPLPDEITWGGPLLRSTWNLPGVVNKKVVIKATLVEHSGPGVPVAVSDISGNDITCDALAGLSGDWPGRILSCIYSSGLGEPDPDPGAGTLLERLEAAALTDVYIIADGGLANSHRWNYYRNNWYPPALTPEQFGLCFDGIVPDGPLTLITAAEFVAALEAAGFGGTRSPGLPDDTALLPFGSAHGPGTSPLINLTITGYDPDTGTLTVLEDPVALGLGIGDLLVIRFKADTITDQSIGDSGLVNGMLPSGIVGDERGLKVVVIAGPGRGQSRIVDSHSSTVYHLSAPWDPDDMPTEDSLWIVVQPAWAQRAEVVIPPTRLQGQLTNMVMPIDTFKKVWAVIAILQDRSGGETPEELANVREIWVKGTPPLNYKEYVWDPISSSNLQVQLFANSTVPHLVVRDSGVPFSVWAKIKFPSSELPVIVDIFYTKPEGAPGSPTYVEGNDPADFTASIFEGGAKIVLPPDTDALVIQDSLVPNLHFDVGGLLSAEVQQVGVTTPGKVLFISIHWVPDSTQSGGGVSTVDPTAGGEGEDSMGLTFMGVI